MEKQFVVIMVSQRTSKDLYPFETEQKAIAFCECENWKWYDENNFCWSLDIVEREVL